VAGHFVYFTHLAGEWAELPVLSVYVWLNSVRTQMVVGEVENSFLLVINAYSFSQIDLLHMLTFVLTAEYPKKAPADLAQLYPKANAKAIRLLGRMLKLNPGDRISVESALEDLYVSKYHDADDEPVCIPVFDFSFEKEVIQGHCVVTNKRLAAVKLVGEFENK
jgi:serine/threonine protein kinase